MREWLALYCSAVRAGASDNIALMVHYGDVITIKGPVQLGRMVRGCQILLVLNLATVAKC